MTLHSAVDRDSMCVYRKKGKIDTRDERRREKKNEQGADGSNHRPGDIYTVGGVAKVPRRRFRE